MPKFENLQTKQTLDKDTLCSMMVFRETNGEKICFRAPLNSFEKFYLGVSILETMTSYMDRTRTELENMVKLRSSREYVDERFLEKREATYEKTKLLTEERMNTLFGEYCTEEKIDLDIQNCMTHSRSVATSLANYLGIMASVTKSQAVGYANNYNNTTRTTNKMENNTGMVIDAMKEIAEGGETPPGSGGEGTTPQSGD